jgi:hypothetical protein
MPVIPATQEAEIRSQPQKTSFRDPISKITSTKKKLVEWLKW